MIKNENIDMFNYPILYVSSHPCCPYCSYKQEKFNIKLKNNLDSIEYICERCNKTFIIEYRVETKYYCWKKK